MDEEILEKYGFELRETDSTLPLYRAKRPFSLGRLVKRYSREIHDALEMHHWTPFLLSPVLPEKFNTQNVMHRLSVEPSRTTSIITSHNNGILIQTQWVNPNLNNRWHRDYCLETLPTGQEVSVGVHSYEPYDRDVYKIVFLSNPYSENSRAPLEILNGDYFCRTMEILAMNMNVSRFGDFYKAIRRRFSGHFAESQALTYVEAEAIQMFLAGKETIQMDGEDFDPKDFAGIKRVLHPMLSRGSQVHDWSKHPQTALVLPNNRYYHRGMHEDAAKKRVGQKSIFAYSLLFSS